MQVAQCKAGMPVMATLMFGIWYLVFGIWYL
jgi:hypothetical protein